MRHEESGEGSVSRADKKRACVGGFVGKTAGGYPLLACCARQQDNKRIGEGMRLSARWQCKLEKMGPKAKPQGTLRVFDVKKGCVNATQASATKASI